ncbi:MAG: hypothetical protein K0Q93_3160 [Nocardioidaceae bacterium]|nr:hypothetical protein [Nocardioidaceae bacterium]
MTVQTISTCVVCGAQTDRFLCGSERSGTGCLGELLRQLGDCGALSRELTVTVMRQDKVTGEGAGFVTGDAEKPLPLNPTAMEAGYALRTLLASWTCDIWESNQGRVPHCSACGVEQALHAEGPHPRERTWYYAVPLIRVPNTVTDLSRWLMRHANWMALHPAADDLFRELMDAIRTARRAVDIPTDRRQFLGVCGFELDGVACPQELYALPGQYEVTCKVCGSCWSAEERVAFLLGIAEDRDVTLAAASMLLTRLGFEAGESDLRKLAQKRRFEPKAIDKHRKRTYRLGDVLGAYLEAREVVAMAGVAA